MYLTSSSRVEGKFLPISVVVVTLLLGLSLSISVVGQQIAIRPDTDIHVKLVPGSAKTTNFRVVNFGDSRVPVEIYVGDWSRDIYGRIQAREPGTIQRSLSPYLSISPTQFTLSPQGSQTVQVGVDLPDDSSGPHWGLIFVESKEYVELGKGEISEEGIETKFKANIRYGVKLYQTDPTHSIRKGSIDKVVVRTAAEDKDSEKEQISKSLSVGIMFKNSGTTFLSPEGRVEIRDTAGEKVATLKVEKFEVLPDTKRALAVNSKKELPPGEYVALVYLDFGGDYLAAKQQRFKIT